MTFERFVAELASRFAGLPCGRVDAEIEQALAQLVEFLGTERASRLVWDFIHKRQAELSRLIERVPEAAMRKLLA